MLGRWKAQECNKNIPQETRPSQDEGLKQSMSPGLDVGLHQNTGQRQETETAQAGQPATRNRRPIKHARKHAIPIRQRASRPAKGADIAPSGSENGLALLDERQRREMIATAAFLRAQRRGFESGAELQDWLAAEEEIDQWLKVVDRGSEEPPLFEE